MNELFGLGWILVRYGFWWGFAAVAALAALGGALGFFLAKTMRKAGAKRGDLKFFCGNAVFVAFLFCAWLFAIGISLWYDFTFRAWLLSAVAVLIWCIIFGSHVFSDDAGTAFLEKGATAKWWLAAISVFCFTVGAAFFWEPEISLVQLRRHERAAWWIAKAASTQDGEEARGALERAGRYGEPVPRYLSGLVHLQHQERAIAAEHFAAWAISAAGKGHLFWNGIAVYLRGGFLPAAELFEASGEEELALASLFRAGTLTEKKFASLAAKRGAIRLPRHALTLIGELIRPVPAAPQLLPPVPPKRRQSEIKKKPAGDLALIMERLDRLEKLLQPNKGPDPRAAAEAAAAKAREIAAAGVRQKKTDAIAYITDTCVSAAIRRRMPELRVPGELPELRRSFFVALFSFSFFLAALFAMNAALRRLSERSMLPTLLGKIVERVFGHSLIAGRIAMRIIAIEPEIGMFAADLARIRASVFPVDITVALASLARARRTVARAALAGAERDDIEHVSEEIRRLSGRFIPEGDETALGILTALREKAKEARRDFLKGRTGYFEAREALISVFNEVMTVGDVIGARRSKSHLTYYDLLGISPQTSGAGELKRAYRLIMSAIHPDRQQEPNPFLETLAKHVNVAYGVLNSPLKKSLYDRELGLS